MALVQPDLEPIGNDSQYRLRGGPYLYTWMERGVLRRIVVPNGYTNDGASVPWLFTFLVNEDGLQRAAALVHDLLYAKRGRLPAHLYQEQLPDGHWEDIGDARIFTRAEADDLFLQIMLEARYARWRAKLAYWAVRSPFGWLAWRT